MGSGAAGTLGGVSRAAAHLRSGDARRTATCTATCSTTSISAALIFYILTIAGVFRLRQTRPDAERPYRAFGYPVVPALYIVGAATILLVLFVYRPATTWPGLVIVLLGVPVYFAWKREPR